MAFSGPIPKRSEERIRRNIPDVPIQKVIAEGTVEAPGLGIDGPHPMILDFWRALRESAQTKYYEPTDWQFARFTLHFANKLLMSSKPSSQMLKEVNSALSNLLVTEGDRRRVRMEIERTNSTVDKEELEKSASEALRERLGVPA